MSYDYTNSFSAQIRKQLSARANETGENLTFVMERFSAQQLLSRLSKSRHRNSFALKGAQLLTVWSNNPHRATRDIDLLSWGNNSPDRLKNIFLDLCEVQVEDDGLVFDRDSIRIEEIREHQEYGGFRIKLRAYLERAWVNIQIDIGFGDAVTPETVEVECPSMLGLSPALLRAYPMETVVAEKTEALVRLGLINGRMKDFSDLQYLASGFGFDGRLLSAAINATFTRRQTELPKGIPVALTERFYNDINTKHQWSGFIKTVRMNSNFSLEDICIILADFLLPVLKAAASNVAFEMVWQPGGSWCKP